jgi:deoxyribodipyrimidine photo-lyase
LLRGEPKIEIPALVERLKLGGVISDFSPLRIHLEWTDQLKEALPIKIAFAQVDGHNIVPVWIASDKLEYGARTIRNKINTKLDEFLTEFPPVIQHPFTIKDNEFTKTNWENIDKTLECDRTVGVIKWAVPGYEGAVKTLEAFMKTKLKYYNDLRNNPNKDVASNLSPWFHFGHISVQRCIVEVKKFSKNSEATKVFMEEA